MVLYRANKTVEKEIQGFNLKEKSPHQKNLSKSKHFRWAKMALCKALAVVLVDKKSPSGI